MVVTTNRPPFKLFRFPNPVVELKNILIKSMGIKAAAKNHLQLPKNVFTTNNFEICNLKSSNSLYGLIFLKSFACHLDVICMRSCLIYMYSYIIRISVVCTRISSVCHSCVIVCHLYVTRMYS